MATPPVQSPDTGTLLAGDRQVLELIATGAPLETTLDTLCRAIDSQSGLRSSIFLLDPAGDRLRLAVGPRLPGSWRTTVSSFPVTETACGAAIRQREQIVSPDISKDELYNGYHDAARSAGIRAVWSTPFFSTDQRPLGTFAVYSDVSGQPSAMNLLLVARAARLASIAVERSATERMLHESEQRLRVVLETLPVGVSVMDREGNITLANPAAGQVWSELVVSGPERYARSKGWWHHTGQALGPDDWPSARARLAGESSKNTLVDIEAFDGSRKTIQVSAAPIHDTHGRVSGAVIAVDDVSAQKHAERALHESLEQLRSLSGRLMRAQDDERRRISQMLHETTAQDLAALKMLLSRLGRTSGLSDEDRNVLNESVELADGVMSEIRTLSYLLYPPFLDEIGLLSAVRWWVEGFTKRSDIAVELDLPARLERLPLDLETTLFRLVQEALINVHRHAASPTATVRLRRTNNTLSLDVQDYGRGMSADLAARLTSWNGAAGVGLASLRERLQQLAGRLEIESSSRGTLIRAAVPLTPTSS
jgi:signal transduction histidine kinase